MHSLERATAHHAKKERFMKRDTPVPASPAVITLTREPGGATESVPRPKTAAQLLQRLGIRQSAALVIREGELLTHDRRIEPGDHIIVRTVVSSG